MLWWQALILGIVEGVTEYLPISSTGHLILTAWLMGLHKEPALWEAAFAFNIVIQSGAIVAVLGLYRARMVQITRGVIGRDQEGRRLAGYIGLAFLPAAVLGILLSDPIEAYLNGPWPVVAALFVGGVLMIIVGSSRRRRELGSRTLKDIDWRIALIIGMSQCVAMWPGMSRSMVTIVAAILLGLRATAAAEFSFLLGVVTLGAATAFKALQDGPAMLEHFGIGAILLGFATATVSAGVAVSWLVRFLNRHGVGPFGWYRLAIAGGFAILLQLHVLTMPQ
jgi:undecaprenyl-diphosphatase